ncbi:MAG: hypothetical protein PHO01_01710 [Desulfotomaculaceae bacterium]|nr:hypothetical protein [Desulfotomaculaceae bacterium]
MEDSLLSSIKSHLDQNGFWTLVGVCSLVFGSYIIAYDTGKKQNK